MTPTRPRKGEAPQSSTRTAIQDEYDLADVVEADYYGTDDDESAEVTA